jgi:histone-lysine N-methyltransferase SETD1
MAGNCRSKERPSKAIFRIAPYNLPPFKVDKNSVGPGEAQQVVVFGFDPFLPETTLKLNFEQFGSIASVQSKTDPATGSFLGIASIKYRDTVRDGVQFTAATSAKQAEAEFNGHRIGQNTVHVEVDREGRRCKRYVESALRKARDAREKNRSVNVAPPPPPPTDSGTPANDSPAPPPNAPKGPSGRTTIKPPEGPRSAVPMNPRAAPGLIIEEETVLSKIKRKPYIHIPNSSVPVLPTTIPHLKKRLKSYDWREVRVDKTGYYVIFDNSKRGEDETERCFVECNDALLFTYKMGMECQKYGNPNYERSPSPERVQAAKMKKEEVERLQREEAEDIEIEKKHRAENIDPVLGALEQLKTELRNKIFDDIKTRIAIPIFHESLDPTRHAAKRRKLGLPDPSDIENKAPGLLFSKAGDTPPQTPRGRHGYSKPLRPHDPNQQRGRKGYKEKETTNAFLDERRRRPAPPRPSHARGLHFKLQQMYNEEEDEDSDDERRTSVTRDTEDQESRPLSRASRNSTPFESESVADTPNKRRKATEWEEDEENRKDVYTDLQKQLVGHLLSKEPEDLATRELELIMGTLPREYKFATRARTEYFVRIRSKEEDDLFSVQPVVQEEEDESVMEKAAPQDSSAKRTPEEVYALINMDDAAITALAKKKKKSKEKIIEQQIALRNKALGTHVKAAKKPVEQKQRPTKPVVAKAVEPKQIIARIAEKDREVPTVEETDDEEIVDDPDVTYDKPRRTVENDREHVLDIDGWQQLLKDDEDLMFARQAFADEDAATMGDAKLWAFKQKQIKALNIGTQGDIGSGSGIDGYYVRNATGSARTEGVKKILNEEKSKYLPHRIKVQKAREERQAQAKANPTIVAEAAKVAAAEKIASTASSRSNRANNRRLVNDINLQKQSLATTNSDADAAIRFNALKKRKKHVKFERSAIHGWGLYADENIGINELIIEYVGEKVRQKVADMREIRYDKQGVGSSYLFRMADDEIVDATKKGGIARFINHSCDPNCTAKIIKVDGTPRIVIYALKDIVRSKFTTYTFPMLFYFTDNLFTQTRNLRMTTSSSARSARQIAFPAFAARPSARAS